MAYIPPISPVTASGTITTQNLVPAGSATAGSAVEISIGGNAGISVQVTGTYTGSLSLQYTLDGTNWITVGGTPFLNVNTGGFLASITSALAGVFQSEATGVLKARVTALAAVTGTATITLMAVINTAVISIDTALPTGANTIGSLSNLATIGTSVTPGTGVGNLGKAEDAASASGDTGVFTLGIRNDAITTPTSTNGDYSQFSVNRFGALYNAGFRTGARTYSSTLQILVSNGATDIMSFFGNATTTVQITKLRISGIQGTGGQLEFLFLRRSTANTGGTTTPFSIVKHEVSDAGNNSTPVGYTANPSALGTLVGNIRRWYQTISGTAGTSNGDYVLEFGDNGKGLILSGTTDGVCLNLNAATITSGFIDVSIEFIEY